MDENSGFAATGCIVCHLAAAHGNPGTLRLRRSLRAVCTEFRLEMAKRPFFYFKTNCPKSC